MTTEPQYNVVDRAATAVTADALPTTQIDGVAWDQAVVGDTVYAGGQFSTARPAGSAPGTNTTPRSNLLSYNIRTGVLNAGFAPTLNGRIKAMAVSPDKSRVYVAGAFTTVNGVTRNRLAAFNTADGSLVTAFAPSVSSEVSAIAVTSTAVYLGGGFGSVNGNGRTKLAAVSPTNGATLAWAPSTDGKIDSMTASPDGTRIIVGGMFATANGGNQVNGLASFSASTAALLPFEANTIIKDYGDKAGIYSLKTVGGLVYGTGYWFGGIAGNFEGPFVVDPYTGKIKWMADCHGDTYDTSVVGTTVYSVSHHHDCRNIGGFPDTDPRSRWMRSNAFTADATTTVGPNQSGGYFDFNGQPSPSIVNWFPEVASGSYTGQSQGGWTSESTNEYLVQGGEFPRVNGTAQQGLVRFAVPALATKKQGPQATAAQSAPVLRGISGNTVRVSWPSNYDRDDQTLTYKLFRTDKPTTPLVTQTKVSQFWNRPTQLFTDSGLSTNTTYTYYVTATDGDGNTLRSSNTAITTGTSVVQETAYSKAVQTDGADHYWRLNESAGATTSVDWASGNDLVMGTGATFGGAGAINGSTDPAATFDGTANGTAGQTSPEVGTDTFTVEAWFKSTSTSGGKIVGFGDSQLGTSNNYDRQVYLDNSGHIVFGVCCSQGTSAVATAGAYNDGAWHQVVASLSPAGMQLYVDGLSEGSNAGVTTAQPYTGYWRVGGDNLNGWPFDKSSFNVAASIDDVAVYPTGLSAAQVRDHYTKSGRTVDIPAAPADAYGKAVYGDNPSLYWRLDEAAGAGTIADASQNRTPGNPFGGVTLGAAASVAPGRAAGFNGADGTISSAKSFSNPRLYSEEVWFSTTTTNGGKLIGFGNARSGGSSAYDRHVYMENDGRLVFGVYTGQLNTITSAKSYNDGTWHHAVATQDTTAGMKFYVDGVEVGTNPQTDAQGYDGYWRIGGDNSWGGNSPFLAGTLDEAAVYPYALTAAQVKAHYQASDAAVNAAPTAAFTTACTDASCYVDGSTSSDDGSVASYAWSFGDGGTATTPTATHVYAASGTYRVTLTVKDDTGKTGTSSQDVSIALANKAPVAAFTSSCTQLDCAFDAAGSSDADGTIAGYAWDFGDSSTSTVAKPSHTYAADGSYLVKLTVTDDDGATTTVEKTVVAKANTRPTAVFTSDCTGLACAFDASGSADADGSIASYAWKFGDGTTGTGRTASHSYTTAGTYQVTLTVTDDAGATTETVNPVTVEVGNVAPTAAFTSTVAGLKVSVDGTSSTDSDGTVASYAWAYGDGTTGTGATDSHTYGVAGTYSVKLTVTDGKGATDSVTKSVTVAAANTSPTAAFTSTVADLKVSVDGTSSTDGDGTVAGYAWVYGDGGTGTGATDSHTYAAPGTYTVKLTVTDNQGATGSVTKSVTVAAAPVDQVVAKDGFGRTGTRWGTAEVGGAWTDTTAFTTNGSKGLITSRTAGSGPTASLGSVSVRDSSTVLDLSIDKLATGGGNYLTLSSRRIGTSEYRMSTRVLADRSVRVSTIVVVNGTATTLRDVAVPGLTYTAGDVLKVRFDVTGSGTTTVSGKVWKAGTTEPAAAQAASTNTQAVLQAAGSVAMQGYVSGSSTNAPVVFTIDNYTVTRLG